jgi:hypothetical protein
VEGAGDELLARTTLARDEDSRLSSRHAVDHREKFAHRGGAADYRGWSPSLVGAEDFRGSGNDVPAARGSAFGLSAEGRGTGKAASEAMGFGDEGGDSLRHGQRALSACLGAGEGEGADRGAAQKYRNGESLGLFDGSDRREGSAQKARADIHAPAGQGRIGRIGDGGHAHLAIIGEGEGRDAAGKPGAIGQEGEKGAHGLLETRVPYEKTTHLEEARQIRAIWHKQGWTFVAHGGF